MSSLLRCGAFYLMIRCLSCVLAASAVSACTSWLSMSSAITRSGCYRYRGTSQSSISIDFSQADVVAVDITADFSTITVQALNTTRLSALTLVFSAVTSGTYDLSNLFLDNVAGYNVTVVVNTTLGFGTSALPALGCLDANVSLIFTQFATDSVVASPLLSCSSSSTSAPSFAWTVTMELSSCHVTVINANVLEFIDLTAHNVTITLIDAAVQINNTGALLSMKGSSSGITVSTSISYSSVDLVVGSSLLQAAGQGAMGIGVVTLKAVALSSNLSSASGSGWFTITEADAVSFDTAVVGGSTVTSDGAGSYWLGESTPSTFDTKFGALDTVVDNSVIAIRNGASWIAYRRRSSFAYSVQRLAVSLISSNLTIGNSSFATLETFVNIDEVLLSTSRLSHVGMSGGATFLCIINSSTVGRFTTLNAATTFAVQDNTSTLLSITTMTTSSPPNVSIVWDAVTFNASNAAGALVSVDSFSSPNVLLRVYQGTLLLRSASLVGGMLRQADMTFNGVYVDIDSLSVMAPSPPLNVTVLLANTRWLNSTPNMSASSFRLFGSLPPNATQRLRVLLGCNNHVVVGNKPKASQISFLPAMLAEYTRCSPCVVSTPTACPQLSATLRWSVSRTVTVTATRSVPRRQEKNIRILSSVPVTLSSTLTASATGSTTTTLRATASSSASPTSTVFTTTAPGKKKIRILSSVPVTLSSTLTAPAGTTPMERPQRPKKTLTMRSLASLKGTISSTLSRSSIITLSVEAPTLSRRRELLSRAISSRTLLYVAPNASTSAYINISSTTASVVVLSVMVVSGDVVLAASQVLMSFVSCNDVSGNDPPSIAALMISVFYYSGPRAIVYGNTALIVGTVLLHACATWLSSQRSSTTFAEAAGSRLRFPALSVTLSDFLLSGVMFGSVVCFMRRDEERSVALATVGVCVCVAVVAVRQLVLEMVVLPQAAWEVYRHRAEQLAKWDARWYPAGRWAPKPLRNAYGPLVATMKRRFARYRVAEVAVSLLLAAAAASGMTALSPTVCRSTLIASAAVSGLFAAFCAATRPFRYPMNRVVVPLCYAVLGVSCALKSLSPDALPNLSLVTTILDMLQTLLLLWKAVWMFWIAYRENSWESGPLRCHTFVSELCSALWFGGGGTAKPTHHTFEIARFASMEEELLDAPVVFEDDYAASSFSCRTAPCTASTAEVLLLPLRSDEISSPQEDDFELASCCATVASSKGVCVDNGDGEPLGNPTHSSSANSSAGIPRHPVVTSAEQTSRDAHSFFGIDNYFLGLETVCI